MDEIDEKYEKLKNILISLKSVLVAFSGGADSTLLLKAAHDTLRARAAAATAVSYIYPSSEMESAKKFAIDLGVEHVIVNYDPIGEVHDFYMNPENRCYICKKQLFSKILMLAENMGCAYVVDGTNADDAKENKIGIKALDELGIKSPLLMAGFKKSEIREILKRLNISTYDKPSFSCFATRIPCGDIISEGKLSMIIRAEEYLTSKNIKNVKVNLYCDTAIIEVSEEEMPKLFNMDLIDEIQNKLNDIGFKNVTLNLKPLK